MNAEEWVLVQPGGQVLASRTGSAAIESVARKVNKRRNELGLDVAIAMPRSRYVAMFPEAAEQDRVPPGTLRAFLPTILLAMLLVCGGLGAPAPAHAAVRVPIEWTAPAGVLRYEGIARRGDGVFVAASLWADSTGAAVPVIVAAGERQRVWVLVSEDWRSGGWMIWTRGCNDAGCAPWSNAVVVAAGLPDTNWMLERGVGKGVSAPRGASVWKHARGRVGWSLERSDSVATARVVHQELVQQSASLRICELYGYWALRGRAVACP